jgi:signal transduction histidine kinase
MPIEFFRRRRAWYIRYGFSLAVTATSVFLTGYLESRKLPHFEMLNLLAVVLSSLFGGIGSAVFSAFLTAAGMDYFYIHPLHSIEPTEAPNYMRLNLFLVVSLATSFIVSALKNAERRTAVALDRARKDRDAREKVFSVVTHDLRAAVTGFLFGIGALGRRLSVENETDTGELLKSLKEKAEMMTHLISDLADCQGLESQTFRIDLERVSTKDLLQRALSWHAEQARAKRISLEISEPIADAPLQCDEKRILQVLSNLIGNSLKYTPDSGRIILEAKDAQRFVRIKVYDTGRGIPPDQIPFVFGEFWRGDLSHPGMGLGLFICKRLVERHGGTIQLTSEPGKGTCVAFSLPKCGEGATDLIGEERGANMKLEFIAPVTVMDEVAAERSQNENFSDVGITQPVHRAK